jgi:hypothetical protein
MKSDGQIAKITIEVSTYAGQVVGVARSMKWNSDHGGKVIKTTPYASRYGPTTYGDKSLKQAILEATEPQIDFSMENLGLVEG